MTRFDDGGRSSVVAALRAELFGPNPDDSGEPVGTPIKLSPAPTFESQKDAYGPFHESGTGQEILLRDRPSKRYGVGVLYPQQQRLLDANEGEASDVADIAQPPTDSGSAVAE